jgi:hypothetical protein
MIAGTLQTDPRSGGVKKSSGVNVLPIVTETWEEVRDDKNLEIDWLIAGYDGDSKTDITIMFKGTGGVGACSDALPEGMASFGGCRLSSGRFVSFFYVADGTPIMQKGRASMYKNGVLNTLAGCDMEIEMKPGLVEAELSSSAEDDRNGKCGKLPPASGIIRPEHPQTKPAAICQDESTQVSKATRKADTGSKDKLVHVGVESLQISGAGFIPYLTLKDAGDLPSGVDPAKKEMSLSDEEFDAIFGMDKATFASLAPWKRNVKKKEVGLF